MFILVSIISICLVSFSFCKNETKTLNSSISTPCGCCSDTTVTIKPAPAPATASCCSAEPSSSTQTGCGCGSPTEPAKQKSQIKGAANSNNDCGVWSLAYIAKSLGVKKDEKTIKKLISYDPNKGTTMQELADAAQKLGLVAKGYRMSYTELTKRSRPIIVYIPNHFMVLTKIDPQKNQLTFADSSKKKVEMPKDEFLSIWQGYVLEIKKKSS
jgi:hypothetical protein